MVQDFYKLFKYQKSYNSISIYKFFFYEKNRIQFTTPPTIELSKKKKKKIELFKLIYTIQWNTAQYMRVMLFQCL